jgi:hypothetical protein
MLQTKSVTDVVMNKLGHIITSMLSYREHKSDRYISIIKQLFPVFLSETKKEQDDDILYSL